MKRFYTLASTQEKNGQYYITLDGKTVKTQSGHDLGTPSKALAEAIMAEWAAQGEEILPDSMPLTQILNTKIDRVSEQRDVMSKTLLNYLDTDLLCYRANEPEELIKIAQIISGSAQKMFLLIKQMMLLVFKPHFKERGSLFHFQTDMHILVEIQLTITW